VKVEHRRHIDNPQQQQQQQQQLEGVVVMPLCGNPQLLLWTFDVS